MLIFCRYFYTLLYGPKIYFTVNTFYFSIFYKHGSLSVHYHNLMRFSLQLIHMFQMDILHTNLCRK